MDYVFDLLSVPHILSLIGVYFLFSITLDFLSFDKKRKKNIRSKYLKSLAGRK